MAGDPVPKNLNEFTFKKSLTGYTPLFHLFFLWTCRLLHGQASHCLDLCLEPMASGNPKKFHKSGQRFMAAWTKTIIYHALRFVGQNSKDSLALLHSLEGLQTRSWVAGTLLKSYSLTCQGLWWWTSTGETQLIVSLVPPVGWFKHSHSTGWVPRGRSCILFTT